MVSLGWKINNKDNGKVYTAFLSKLDVEATYASDTDHGDAARSGCIVPFWRVTTTTNAGDANMGWKQLRCEVNDGKIVVPCLHNTKAIAPGDYIVLLKETSAAKAKSKARGDSKAVIPASKRTKHV